MSTGDHMRDISALREALAIAWPEGDHAEPNAFTEALAALDRIERRLTRATHSSIVSQAGNASRDSCASNQIFKSRGAA